MEKRIFLIAKGNPTLLVWDCPINKQESIVKKYLGQVDQIGFISEVNGIPNLSMMGNELCINATMAFASTLKTQGNLLLNESINICYRNLQYKTEISLSLSYKLNNNIVIFSGIGFIFNKNDLFEKETVLIQLANIYKLPAFGFIQYKNNQINPYIYVRQTNSLIKESACGSGSIAYSLFKNVTNIIQPTKKIISVTKKSNKIIIQSNITEETIKKGGEINER